MRRLSSLVLVALLVVLMLPLIACGPSTPEGKVAKARASYTVEINSWNPKKEEPPMADPEVVAGEAMPGEAEAVAIAEEAAAVVEGEAGEVEEEMAEEIIAGPQTTNILFDLVIYFRGDKSLPGITIDITHASAGQEEKSTYRHYVETSGIINGETRQHAFLMEDVPFEDGDVFSANIVSGIPQDLSLYREFSEQAP